jgi:putative heme-binding domain-containing protein
MLPRATMWALLPICVLLSQRAAGQAQLIPHHQDKPPGPALSPAEAVKKMTVPPGFTVEVVASEPDIVNPVAMTFDERGRVWITESLEYPRRSPGSGRDRVKVLEDTDGDGKADKFTVFAEGLNIPSGIAVGHGGVWVANAPDILFLQDTDGDGKADKREVVVTGFGRSDTHELPNSLTWGPDGWLYGINGVFNFSHVKHKGKDYEFTCALFRIHPQTRDFELFAEGTSNPWGVAWDNEGSAFFSACVIDHLWHITESGYYHRQGGPYPPFTWKIGSIVKHKHQKAAYCGIHFFDSDAYPPEYRERLYMGNIHGNCVNVDVLERDGSTYFARPNDDFLTANDAWFMPVVQKTGPDGSLYVLDWYDQYHCYQDANRDPQGIDRLKGRLYRIRYKDTPRAFGFDLAKESDERLIERLASPNVYYRDIAQRLLTERSNPAIRQQLEQLVFNDQSPRKARMHGLWALVGSGPLDPQFHRQLMAHSDPGFRAWGVRAAGNMHKVDSSIAARVKELASDSAADVKLQVAIAAGKIAGLNAVDVLADVLAHGGDDKLIPHIVWQNLHPLLEDNADRFLARLEKVDLKQARWSAEMLPLLVERLLARRTSDPAAIVSLVTQITDGADPQDTIGPRLLATLAANTQSGEISGPKRQNLQAQLQPLLSKLAAQQRSGSLQTEAVLLAATWGDATALQTVRDWLLAGKQPVERRLKALDALVAAHDKTVAQNVPKLLGNRNGALQAGVLASLGRLEDAGVAPLVLKSYPKLAGDVRPKAIELLTERPAWTRELVAAVERKEIPPEALNVNQLRKLQSSKDPAIAEKVTKIWGQVRTERNPQREQVVNQMRTFLKQTPGDPQAGIVVFKKVCGQCHKLFGEGQDVGPDITLNGRNNFEQLLSNVFDPSLVIGASYQARTVATTDGRILVGLLVEDNPQRIVLKVQGGKLETIPRDNIDQIEVSKLSMMPEDLEKQLKPQELADLFAYITREKPLGAAAKEPKSGAP